MRDIAALEERTRAKCQAHVEALALAGIRHAVIETRRTPETQAAYYAQGRRPLEEVNAKRRAAGLGPISEAENRRTVTKTLDSRHLIGEAYDLVPLDSAGWAWWDAPREVWLRIGELGEAQGLEWGGRWGATAGALGWDCPHYQLRR